VCSPDALAARVRVHPGEQRRRNRPARRRAHGARVRLARTAAAAARRRRRRRRRRKLRSACLVSAKVGGVGLVSSIREVCCEICCEIGGVCCEICCEIGGVCCDICGIGEIGEVGQGHPYGAVALVRLQA
jgi:hypothetical protein